MQNGRFLVRLRAWLLSRWFALGMLAIGGAMWLVMTFTTLTLIVR